MLVTGCWLLVTGYWIEAGVVPFSFQHQASRNQHHLAASPHMALQNLTRL